MITKLQKSLFLSFVISLPINAIAINCPTDKKAYSVSGKVETINVIEEIIDEGVQKQENKQEGMVTLIFTLKGSDNPSIFEGDIFGTTTFQKNINIFLNHDMYFREGDNIIATLFTTNDHAIASVFPLEYDYFGEPCGFSVTEVISNLNGGVALEGITGYMIASGVTYNCDMDGSGDTDNAGDMNYNNFDIVDGEVCY